MTTPPQDLRLSGETGPVWRHVDLSDGVPAADAEAALRDLVNDETAIEAMLADETRPRRARFDGGDVVILRGVNLAAGATPEDMVSLRVWIGERDIVSVSLRELRAVVDLRRRVAEGRGPAHAADLLLGLAETLTERLKETVRAAEGALEDAEERILDGAEPGSGDPLRALRRRAITLRRYAEPQLEAFEDLLEDPPDWLDDRRRQRLKEIANALERSIESLSATREHIAAVHDQLALQLAERTRRTNQLLAIVAAVFLPLNLLAALLGANVGGVPLAGSPYGFWALFGGALLALTAGLAVLLRSRWFR